MKTDLTRAIEKALRTYSPRRMGGININVFRGRVTAYEVPVECGCTDAGLIDCVKVCEYFGDLEWARVCRCHGWKRDGLRRMPIDCPKGIPDSERTPEYCNNAGCHWNLVREAGRPKVLITCFEIKVTASDFRSKNGHNFVGNLNYYVVPKEIYKAIEADVPQGIGIIAYDPMGHACLRRSRDSEFREMSDETQKWMILNVLKRIWRTGGNG